MTFDTKQLPDASLTLLTQPARDRDYQHFSVPFHGLPPQTAAAVLPFQPDAAAHSPVNAWWLADASLLSYWDAAAAATRFAHGAGLPSRLIARAGTACYVATQGTFSIVAFRGTEPDDLLDIRADVDVVLRPWSKGGHVHTGFAEALAVVWDEVADAIGTSRPWFTGHSLGGAMAILAADRHGSPGGVYTFGAPRIGDRTFADGFNQRHRAFRYVNGKDLVTHVPSDFSHAGEEIHVGASDGTIVGRGLIDHTPRRYATLLWNALVESGADAVAGL